MRVTVTIATLFFLFSTPVQIIGQVKEYILDATASDTPLLNVIDMKGTSPQGTGLSVNSRYFMKNGKPWLPVMGEFHYVRFPVQYWEEQLMKMKAGGITIVATYVFWNAHEYPKGVWNWEGDRDLRKFISLCQKHGLMVWLRCGPWSHGEQLNGGFPQWIEHMKNNRTNDAAYLAESQKLFAEIGRQTNGLYFNDGGPIIGAQLENEYASGQAGHITALKKMAISNGIRPVFFSVTANTVFDDKNFEALPLQGGYPYRGWERAGGGPTKDFLYANDQWILSADLGRLYYDTEKYPRGLCEQGAGSQMTFANRFIVEPAVVEAHLQNQIGRGMNLIGYYMFQGGTQMPGLKEPGHPESYDFQAPLDEFGLPRTSYKYLKIIHHFINDFGQELAAADLVQPQLKVVRQTDTDTLRYIGRFSGNSGFIFLNNTQVRITQPDKKFKLQVNLKNESLTIPSNSHIQLKGQTTAILPLNLNVSEINIRYATVQPVARFSTDDHAYLFFTQVAGMHAELLLDTMNIRSLKTAGMKMVKKGQMCLFECLDGKPGKLEIINSQNEKISIVVLTREQAENSWRIQIDQKEYLIITAADLMSSGENIELRQLSNPVMQFSSIPALENVSMRLSAGILKRQKDFFDSYEIRLKKVNSFLHVDRLSPDSVYMHLPIKLPADLSDIFVKIDYNGGSAECWSEKNILTDNLYNGLPWNVGVKRYMNNYKPERLLFKVKPWNNEITGVEEDMVRRVKNNPLQIQFREEPQYRTILSLSK